MLKISIAKCIISGMNNRLKALLHYTLVHWRFGFFLRFSCLYPIVYDTKMQTQRIVLYGHNKIKCTSRHFVILEYPPPPSRVPLARPMTNQSMGCGLYFTTSSQSASSEGSPGLHNATILPVSAFLESFTYFYTESLIS